MNDYGTGKHPSDWTRDDVLAIAQRESLDLNPRDITAGPYGWCIDGMRADDWFAHMLEWR